MLFTDSISLKLPSPYSFMELIDNLKEFLPTQIAASIFIFAMGLLYFLLFAYAAKYFTGLIKLEASGSWIVAGSALLSAAVLVSSKREY